MSENVIEIQNLCKSYFIGDEELQILKNIDFSVPRGDYVSIMGHSGAGKSTLLNILGCLDTVTSGKYLLNNNDISQYSDGELADIRNGEIGFIFQNFNLLPKLSIFGNVELPLIYTNMPKKKRTEAVKHILNRFGLWERRHHKPNEISGGQKQRAAIARALVKNPAVIFADEPTGNLDSKTTEEILEILDEISSEGNTILMITHEKDVAERAKRIIHIVDGKIEHQ